MKRNKFSLSHFRLFSCDMGNLIPIACYEALPGDTIQHATTMLVRCSPLLAPVYHPVDVRIHHWFVPNRLIWDSWEKFITGGPDGMDASQTPFINTSGGIAVGSLANYLGLPITSAALNVSALPFRAYALIWNEYYRDQDLQVPLPMVKTDGSDGTTSKALAQVAWEKDYFTSSRPWEQKGPSISVPVTGQAPIKGLVSSGTSAVAGANYYGSVPAHDILSGGGYVAPAGTSTAAQVAMQTPGSGAVSAGNRPMVYADFPAGTAAISMNNLRSALALQRYEEARARYGSRYVEYLRYLGVRSSDARLQRPEYLGGGRNTIQFSEVLQTGPGAAAGSDVGNLKGHGISSVRSNRYRRFFEEHGYVVSLVSVRPKTIYMNGLPKSWIRRSKDEYWQREFQHIGQQKIQKQEIYASSADPGGTFGFQDRYDEYRRMESFVAGEFATTALNFWHFARDFASEPALNDSFVRCIPTERTFAQNTNHVLWVYAKHSIQARRQIASEGTSFIF